MRSAEAVVEMAESCKSLVEDVGQIKSSFRNLSRDVEAFVTQSPKEGDSIVERDRIYAVGTRIKFLMDTPEVIWGCLDELDHLESARRYVKAEQVNRLITKGRWKDTLHRFPLLRHQWPVIEKFKGQITERARSQLAMQENTLRQASNSLTALASLEGLRGEALLKVYLDVRLSWMKQHLASIRMGEELGMKEVEAKMRVLVRSIQHCLCQAGQLFLVGAEQRHSSIHEFAVSSGQEGVVFADIIHDEDEVMLWQNAQMSLEEKLSMIENPVVSQLCAEWLDRVSALIKENGLTLFPSVSDLGLLEGLQSAMEDEISKATPCAKVEEWLATLQVTTMEDPWEATCEVVLRKPIDLWASFFEEIFVAKAKSLIVEAYDLVLPKQKARHILDLIASEWVPSSSLFACKAWPLESAPSRTSTMDGDAEATAAKNQGFSWHTLLPEVLDELDSGLFQALKQAVHFINSSEEFSSSRKAELEPLVKLQCKKTMQNLEHLVLTTMEDLERATADSEEQMIISVEQRLFLARLCSDVASGSSSLHLTLASAERWSNIVSMSSLSQGMRRLGALGMGTTQQQTTLSARELVEVQELLHKVSLKASRAWIEWATSNLARSFEERILSSNSFRTSVTPKWWEEVEMESSGTEGPIKLSLPNSPSAITMSYLFSACCELHRAGAHFLDGGTLRFFEWELGTRWLETIESLLAEGAGFRSSLSEKGVLQLLMDVKLVEDVLAGCSDGSASRFDGSSSHLRWKKIVAPVLAKLTALIDPIDWATYEPYLWKNEAKTYQRTCVLLGLLTQTRRLHSGHQQKIPYNADTNIMDMSTTAPRFMYLPVSAPALGHAFLEEGSGAFGTSGEDISEEDSFSWGRSIIGQVQKGGSLFEHADKVQERAAQAMASLGEYLPPAGGLLSSLTKGVSNK